MEDLLKSKGYKPKTGVVKTCICGKQFYIRKSEIKQNNYCSKKCYAKSILKDSTLICIVCGKQYHRPPSQVKWRGSSYCSHICQWKHKLTNQSAENNPMWRGGVSSEHHRIRQSKQFKDWRTSVFERDNYTCVICGQRGMYLEPHHIKPFAYFPDHRFDINNGQTMCKKCHSQTDNHGDKAKKLYELA